MGRTGRARIVRCGEDACGASHEQRAYGDCFDKDDRYRRTGEFLDVVRELRVGKTVDLKGDHLIRLHAITRDTSEQASAEANRLLHGFDAETVRSVQAGLARSASEGRQRMLALDGANRDSLEINLWAGIGLVRRGAGTA